MVSILERTLPVDGVLPLVTIVIPVYNGSSFLKGAIDSALEQTYSNLEVIVVNDGSDDDGATENIALSFGGRIRYFSKGNGGVASALNFAIRKMTGDYFSWLSHDDLYFSEKISQQIAFLRTHDAARTVVYSDYSIFTDEKIANAVCVSLPGVSSKYFRYWLTARSSLHGCSLLIPRTVFEEVGDFNERFRTTQDYDLWFRAAEYYSFVHLPVVLVHTRSHVGQDTRNKAQLAFKESSDLHLAFAKKLSRSDLPGETSGAVGASYLILASRLWAQGFVEAGDHCAGVAKSYGISNFRVLAATWTARCVYLLRRTALRLFSSQTKQQMRQVYARLRRIPRGLKRF
ncbi:glycosyltransferase [Pseudomonas costantinii]|uniref:Glycosyltransferase 2-like domain-containing protein n=1 Tax=Pseudomonas costantinii TaxID=168469 RepID=A0A1S2V700_9PSED|nr:glycosyltransferase [Pseudomonas costantinii]OIN54155.1 hypothetical protein BFL40_05490 [Pseudomonas costantinii]SED61653.1 hypothetical protein SAMN04515675_1770 [Pseudomonas costantinii]